MRTLTLANAAIATSGDLWQYSLVDGVRRSHILDPATGLGIPGPTSVSAIAPTALDADAAATAFSVMGAQRGCALAEQLPEIEAMVISKPESGNWLRYTATTAFAR